MPESLAERLKRLASEKANTLAAKQAETDFQARVNSFINDNVKAEFGRLIAVLKEKIDEANPHLGDLPKFQFFPNGTAQMGNYSAGFYFEKPSFNSPVNGLTMSCGPNPQSFYPFGGAPKSKVFRFSGAAKDTLDGIVWMGDLGELTSAQLCEIMLEELTKYYLDHAKKH